MQVALRAARVGRRCSTPAGAQSATIASADRQFVMEAAQGGMAEVELGRLATDKASSNSR